jgi:hypothetical protein
VRKTARCIALAALIVGLGTPGSLQAQAAGLRFEYEPVDTEFARSIEGYAREGIARIETYFRSSFPDPVTVIVLPDRAAFDAYASEKWGMPQTQCWMVGAAATRSLVLVSPRHWTPECDHDPADETHVRDIVVHELVHVFHMQHNPSDEFAGAEEVGWFAEGVATHVSGQLEMGHASRAREAVEAGAEPERLVDAWSGPYRYGVAGSLAAFIEERVGRDAYSRLLGATTQAELLEALDMTEAETLAAWRNRVLAGPGSGAKLPSADAGGTFRIWHSR